MPVKIARSAPRPSFGLPELLAAIHTSRQSCCKAGKVRIFALVWESSGESRFTRKLWMHWMARIAYFHRSVAAQFAKARFNCPSCGSALSSVVDRKYLITQLRRCGNCQLMFRTPTDDPANNLLFYENEYTQGFTTDLPSDAALADMKQLNFAGTEKCYSYYSGVLIQLGMKPGSSVFDYGCSWGYGSYQLSQAGFEVVSFE